MKRSLITSGLVLVCLACEHQAVAADKVLWLNKKAKIAVTRLALGYVRYPSDLYDETGRANARPRTTERMDRDLRLKLLQKLRALGYEVEDTTNGLWYEGRSAFIDVSHGGLQAAIGAQPQRDATHDLAESGKQEWARYPDVLPSGTVLLAFGVYKQDVLLARDMLSDGYHFNVHVTVAADILTVASGKKPSILWANTYTLTQKVVGPLGGGLRVDPAEGSRAVSEGLEKVLAALPPCRRP